LADDKLFISVTLTTVKQQFGKRKTAAITNVDHGKTTFGTSVLKVSQKYVDLIQSTTLLKKKSVVSLSIQLT
jgi:hypothetical protein